MKYSCTIRYNPAKNRAKRSDYGAALVHLGTKFTDYVYEHKNGVHMHGNLEWTGRYPRLKGYHIWLRPFTEPQAEEHWEFYKDKEPEEALYEYPNFDIRKLSSGSFMQPAAGDHPIDPRPVGEDSQARLEILYDNAPYPY